MAERSVIKAIIFDCFGVLYTGSLTELASHCANEHDTKELYDATRAADHGFLSRDDYIAKVMELTGLSKQEIVSLMSSAQVRSRGVFRYAEELKSRGYKIAVLSNIGRDTIQRLFTPEDYELFNAIIASGDIGITKPHITAYDRTLDRLRVAPSEAIMIDDAYSNIAGAIEAGMYGVVFTSLVDLKDRVEVLIRNNT